MKAMLMTRLKIVAAVVLAVGFVGGGVGVATYRAAPVARAKPGPRPVAPPEEPDTPMVELPLPVVPAIVPPSAPEVPEDGNRVTYRSGNFAVTAPTAEIAKRVGDAAEKYRKTYAVRWLGREMPKWPKLCPLRVKITKQGTGAATTFQFDNGKVLSQEMHLEGSLERILVSALPHEITHTVLAFHFKKPIPRWADEGASVLSEDGAEHSRHETMLRKILDQGRRIPLRRLFALREFPADVMVLYCQGYSLSRFLVQAGGRKTFLEFVADGMEGKWDAAVKKHYSYRTVEELEAAWLASVARLRPAKETASVKPVRATAASEARPAPSGAEAAALEKHLRAALPTGPAPIQVLASLHTDGRLLLWKSVTAYTLAKTYTSKTGQIFTHYVPQNKMQATLYDLEKVSFFDTHGKKIEAKKLKNLLKGETPVLVSADGRPVDPLHLRLVKEGTLILVLPVASTPAPVAPNVVEPLPMGPS